MVQFVWIAVEVELFADCLWLYQCPLCKLNEEAAVLTAEEVDQIVVEVIIQDSMCHETGTGDGATEAGCVHVSTLAILAKPNHQI